MREPSSATKSTLRGVTSRVEGLEKGLEYHGTRTLQAVETLTTTQAEQGAKILTAMEGKIRQIESTAGSTHSTNDGGRTPALIMGGWPPDTLAADVLDKANAMARDLKLQLNLQDAFVPGVPRGFVLIPMKPNQDETEDDMRQRAQACIRRVRLAGVDLGTKLDGNKAKLCLAVSQPPEKRRRAALAGEVKRLIIEAGGEGTVHRIEPEWRQSLRGVSHDIHPPGGDPCRLRLDRSRCHCTGPGNRTAPT